MCYVYVGVNSLIPFELMGCLLNTNFVQLDYPGGSKTIMFFQVASRDGV